MPLLTVLRPPGLFSLYLSVHTLHFSDSNQMLSLLWTLHWTFCLSQSELRIPLPSYNMPNLFLFSISFILLCVVINFLPVCPPFLDIETLKAETMSSLCIYPPTGAFCKLLHVFSSHWGFIDWRTWHNPQFTFFCDEETEKMSEWLIVATGGDRVIFCVLTKGSLFTYWLWLCSPLYDRKRVIWFWVISNPALTVP